MEQYSECTYCDKDDYDSIPCLNCQTSGETECNSCYIEFDYDDDYRCEVCEGKFCEYCCYIYNESEDINVKCNSLCENEYLKCNYDIICIRCEINLR
jgi:hypothetical protein